MSSITGLIGASGGASGSGFQAPAAADITNPVTQDQINQAYTGVQGGLTQQNQLLGALQGQNGLANQSSVYNQLQGVTNGTGPNPAQAQLAQATGANTANQAALMAGQRGASQNVGLIARQAAQQGAANQQNAAGQAASLQAQQSLNALGQMGGLATTQAGQQIGQVNTNTTAQQNEQQQLLGAQQGYNSAQVSNQASVNAGNTALANTSLQGQQAMIGGLTNSASAALKAKGGKIQKYAQGSAYVQSPPMSDNEWDNKAANPNAPQSPTIASTAPNYAAPATGGPSPFAQHIKNAIVAAGSSNSNPATTYGGNSGAQSMQQGFSNLGSSIGSGLKSLFSSSPNDMTNSMGTQGTGSTDNDTDQGYAKGGPVPAMVSPGEKYLTPSSAKAVAKEGKNPMKVGKTIPGKPKVSGAKDSYANDIVPATLEEGGIVIPRSVTQAKDSEKKAIEFVRDHYARGGQIPKKPK